MIDLIRLFRPTMELTPEEAQKVAMLVPQSYMQNGQYVEYGYARALKNAFPQYNWRVAQDRTGERTRSCMTTLEDDPREHYLDDDNGYCPRCPKHHTKADVARIKAQLDAMLGDFDD